MIAAVRGEVLEIGLDHAVVDVGGVGLAVQAIHRRRLMIDSTIERID